ncbi:carboxypeptidase-like regulatory domain-containing protein [Bacteroidota bacterium]
MKRTLAISLFFVLSLTLTAQENDPKLVQFSGLILIADSSLPIPYAHIRIQNTHWGTISSIEGFFSLVVRENDTIIFSALGFKKRKLVIHNDIEGNKLSVLMAMTTDTLTFDETLIYPWPSKSKFKEAFLAADPNKTYYDIAMENLDPDKMRAISKGMKMDGSESQHYYMNQQAGASGYLGGQTNYAQFPGMGTPIPLSLLDPVAWYKFIKALKEGKFKKQDKE